VNVSDDSVKIRLYEVSNVRIHKPAGKLDRITPFEGKSRC